MRVAQVLIGQRVAGDGAIGRIELADHAVLIAGIPHHPVLGDDHVVRMGARVNLVALELALHRIEHRDVIARLSHEPDSSVGGDRRIPRPALRPGNGPLGELKAGILGKQESSGNSVRPMVNDRMIGFSGAADSHELERGW